MTSTTLVEAAYVVLVAARRGFCTLAHLASERASRPKAGAMKAAAAMHTNDSVFRALSIDELVIVTAGANGP